MKSIAQFNNPPVGYQVTFLSNPDRHQRHPDADYLQPLVTLSYLQLYLASYTTAFQVWTVDMAGNNSPINNITCDTTVPVLTLATVPAYTNQTTFNVSTTASDIGSGLASGKYKLDSGTETTFNQIAGISLRLA